MGLSFTQVSEERFDEQRDVLPPAVVTSYGFLVGEPHDYRVCTVHGFTMPVYAAFVVRGGKFYEGEPLTIPEFRKIDIEEVVR